MKKLLLATAIAALSVSAANAAPTVYGKAFVTADYVNIDQDFNITDGIDTVNGSDDNNTVEINSHSSRLGFKGSEAMTANTDVIYQLEYGIGVDGDERTFKSRDTYLGVANKDFGQFRFGRNTSVLDYVNNVTVNEGYWDNLGGTKLNEENDLAALNMLDNARVNNSIVWIAPKYNNLPLELALQYSSDEEFEDSNNGFGASLMFDQGTGFTAGVAYTKDMDANGEVTLIDTSSLSQYELGYGGDVIRTTATVDLGKYVAYPITLGAMYQQADYDFSEEKEKGLVVSGEMGLKNFARPASVYLQYNKTTNLNGFDDSDSDQIVLGGKYMFKDNMIAHAYVGQNSADLTSFGKVDDTLVRIKNDISVFAVGGGVEYKF